MPNFTLTLTFLTWALFEWPWRVYQENRIKSRTHRETGRDPARLEITDEGRVNLTKTQSLTGEDKPERV